MGALLLGGVEVGEQGFGASDDCTVDATHPLCRGNRDGVADPVLEQLGEGELQQGQARRVHSHLGDDLGFQCRFERHPLGGRGFGDCCGQLGHGHRCDPERALGDDWSE